MKKSLILVFGIALIITGFQNCGGRFSADLTTAKIASTIGNSVESNKGDLTGVQDVNDGGDTTVNDRPPVTTVRNCAAGSISWSVGSSSCSANYAALNSSPNDIVVNDSSTPVTGRAYIACTDGVVSIINSKPKTCVTATGTTPPTTRSARLSKSVYNIGEDSNIIFYTGGTVSDDVYVCWGASIYACQSDAEYRMISKPSNPTSPTQEAIFAEVSLWTIAAVNFSDAYYFKAKKKLADGSFQSLGSDSAYLRFKGSDVDHQGGATYGPSTAGPNRFEVRCFSADNYQYEQTVGYQQYNGSNVSSGFECFYKFSH